MQLNKPTNFFLYIYQQEDITSVHFGYLFPNSYKRDRAPMNTDNAVKLILSIYISNVYESIFPFS